MMAASSMTYCRSGLERRDGAQQILIPICSAVPGFPDCSPFRTSPVTFYASCPQWRVEPLYPIQQETWNLIKWTENHKSVLGDRNRWIQQLEEACRICFGL